MRRSRCASALGAAMLVAACASSGTRATVVTVAAPTTSAVAAVATATTSAPSSTTTAPASTPASSAVTTTATTTPTTTAVTTPPTPAPPATPRLGAVAVKLTPVVTLTEPIHLTTRTGDTALYVAERRGRIVRVVDGAVAAVVLDMQSLTQAGGERGLLGFAFSPDGAQLYASYTNNDGSSVIDEYQMAGDSTADAGTRRPVLSQRQPYANHNGGDIVFGPDGMLYFGLGDGGSANDPQRNSLKLSTWLGKLLRIDPRASGGASYAVPADNPFLDTDGARAEIWAYGLRNPWRFTFDAATGDLWIGDVGQGAWEEVDVARAAEGRGRGLDFGWSAWEGTHRFNNDQSADDATPPIHEYPHGSLGCSITGGYVYRGAAIPALQGAYVFADYCAQGIRAFDPANPADATKLVDRPANVVGFGQGPGNELYALSFDGNVYRFDAA